MEPANMKIMGLSQSNSVNHPSLSVVVAADLTAVDMALLDVRIDKDGVSFEKDEATFRMSWAEVLTKIV